MHPTHELLLAVLDGKFPREELEKIDLEHRASLCPTCQQEIKLFHWHLHHRENPNLAGLSPEIDRTKMSKRELESARKRSMYWIRELQKKSAPERRRIVDRAVKRFRGSVFANLLVEESRKHIPGNPEEAYSWADTALVAHYHTSGSDDRPGVLVRIAAYRGNALRIMGEFVRAESDFGLARRILDDHDITDLSICAEFYSLEASLRQDKAEFGTAAKLLHRTVLFYRLLDETELRARTEIKLSQALFHQDELDEAECTVQAALEDLSADGAPMLYLMARGTQARILEALGDPVQALAILDEDQALQEEHLDQLSRFRIVWLRGKIDLSLGRAEEAERKLSKVFEQFTVARIGYEAALVALELALLLLEKGELERVKQLARSSFRLISTQNVHADALVAIKIFREAALTERLTAETIRKLHGQFKLYGLAVRTDKKSS